ncbi:phage recombination protein Bet [Treponema sp. Marseille-Q4130]|uniref:phage recombination protein Bet n=1 Tax=Treponema sp. Marseille-Q4130 TaxID=2766702 RepID=UPI0016524179|nr:phage recombination protein Bet [Treponema sp. Marseille-Q4130]MBC6720343.1 phage recombination protein Bet [Treponema sp. Marseille-Q4130]
MNEIIKKEPTEIITPVDEKTIMEYLDTTGLTKSLLSKEKAMFVNMARLYGLNPFKREIYCTVYGEGQYRQCSIVTGYEVYLKRAERIGKLDGWQAQITGNLQDGTLAATVTIWRKDWTHPFTHTAFYTECVQTSKKTGEPNAIWRKMPSFMTRKVAIAQAFRLCFSDEFGGMPYTNDEMGVDAPKERDITHEASATIVPDDAAETPNTEAKNDTPAADVVIQLEMLLTKYGNQLSGKPYELAEEALRTGSDAEVIAMYDRVVSYLKRKGIQVGK